MNTLAALMEGNTSLQAAVEDDSCQKAQKEQGDKTFAGKYEYLVEGNGIRDLISFDLNESRLKNINKPLLSRMFSTLQTYIRSRGDDLMEATSSMPAVGEDLKCASPSVPTCHHDGGPVVLGLIQHLQDAHNGFVTLLKTHSESKLEATRRILELEFLVREKDADLERASDEMTACKKDKEQSSVGAKNSAGAGGAVDVVNIITELRTRQEKEKNLVIYGIDEDTDENPDAAGNAAITSLFNEVMDCGETAIERSFRLGKPRGVDEKPRPIKVFLRSVEHRELVLRNTSKIRNLPDEHESKHIFVRADLTVMQRQELQKERDQRRAEGAFTIADSNDYPLLQASRWRGGAAGRRPRGHAFGYGLGPNNFHGYTLTDTSDAGFPDLTQANQGRGRGDNRRPWRTASRGSLRPHHATTD